MNKNQSRTIITVVGIIVFGIVIYYLLNRAMGMYREKAIAEGIQSSVGSLGKMLGQ